MSFVKSIRVALVVAAACAAAGAQTLPATAPTTPGVQATAPQKAPNPADQPAKRAEVKYAVGTLSVSADNSSLNQILRDIGRLTGMTITGGVTDERVYGSYGPADTSTVLSALLKGTGSNMMLVVGHDQAPKELVLTPRGGGPTPPSPNAARDRGRDEDDLPPQRMPRNPRPDGAGVQPQAPPPQFNPPQPPQSPAATQVNPQFPPPPTATTAPGTDTTTQQSPNGVPTPQDIYNQLLKLQQQKPATPPQ